MPPYASQQDSSFVVSTTSNNDDIFRDFGTVDASIQKDAAAQTPGIISPSLSQNTQDTDASSSLSRLDKLLDLNPCMISLQKGSFTVSTPATSSSSRRRRLSPSIVFKRRRKCVECEKYCSRFRGGYKIEQITSTSSSAYLSDEESDETLCITTRKVYYHKNCAQIKQYRNEHNQKFMIVLKELIDRSRAIELEAQRKRMEMQQKRMEVMRLEAERKEHFQLEEDKDAKSSKKKKLPTKKFLNHIKNAFLSCKGRNGTTADAVILANLKWAAIEYGGVSSGNGYYQEYLDIKTNRMYYTNGVNTTWNKPESYNPYKA